MCQTESPRMCLAPIRFHSSTSHTCSKHSLVILTPSSITVCGTASPVVPSPVPAPFTTPFTAPAAAAAFAFPSAFAAPFGFPVFLCTPGLEPDFDDAGIDAADMEVDAFERVGLEDAELGAAAGLGFEWSRRASSVSRLMSANTRSMSLGKVVHSPERRRERAWRETLEGQLEGWAWRAWWRVCSILCEERF
jgi:hypothetical protein